MAASRIRLRDNLPLKTDVDVDGVHTLTVGATISGTVAVGDVSVLNFPADQLVHATNLDIAISALRDALRGVNNKTLSDIITSLAGTLTVDTELAAALALAEGVSNPTTAPVAGCLMIFNGATWDRVRVANIFTDVNGVSINSIATVWTPTTGKKFRLMGGMLSASAALSVLFEDNAAGAGNFIFRTPKLLADTPYNFDLGNGKLSAAANNVLKATGSANGTITGTLYGTEE